MLPEELPLGTLTPTLHEITIPVGNSGPAREISRVHVDCDCFTIEPPPITLAAASTTNLHATLDLRRAKPGRFARMAIFETGGEKYFLTLTGTVTASRTWSFDETVSTAVETSQSAQLTSAFRRLGDGHPAVKAVFPSENWIRASARPNPAGFELVCTVGPDVPEGRHRAEVVIELDDPAEPRLVQHLDVQVPESFRVAPESRYLADARVGRRIPVAVQSDSWATGLAPVFVVDGVPAEIVDASVAPGGLRQWTIGVVPTTLGMNEKKIRVLRPSADSPSDAVLVADLTIILRVLE